MSFATDQCLLLECGSPSIEDEDGLDVVEEELTDACEEESEVCSPHGLPLSVPSLPVLLDVSTDSHLRERKVLTQTLYVKHTLYVVQCM